MVDKDNYITFEDQEGKTHQLKIYFTYDSDRTKKRYIVFFEENSDSELLAGVLNEDGSIDDIETDAEYDELEEVIKAYQNEHKE